MHVHGDKTPIANRTLEPSPSTGDLKLSLTPRGLDICNVRPIKLLQKRIRATQQLLHTYRLHCFVVPAGATVLIGSL